MSKPRLLHTSSRDDLLEDSSLTALREKPLQPLHHAIPSSLNERCLPQSTNSAMDIKALLAACILGMLHASSIPLGYLSYDHAGAGVSMCTIAFHQRGDINIIRREHLFPTHHQRSKSHPTAAPLLHSLSERRVLP